MSDIHPLKTSFFSRGEIVGDFRNYETDIVAVIE